MKENHGRADTQYSRAAQSDLNMHAPTPTRQAISHLQDAAFPHRLRTAKIFFVGEKDKCILTEVHNATQDANK